MPPTLPKHIEWAGVAALIVLALLARSVGHSTSPPGWRDDELSNALVVSQHVRDGEIRIYYDDASGHEGLYHWLQAVTMALVGPGVWGIRGVSILAGTAAVGLTYWLTRHMFHPPIAFVGAGLLALSFWGLMYSRSGQRHVLVTVTTLLAFGVYWLAIHREDGGVRYALFGGAGLALGVGFYTYFASRGVPLIILVWVGYLWVWKRDLFNKVWRGTAVTLGVAAACAVPLIVTLQQQPEAETRVAELAKPIYDARDGNFSTLASYTVTTLSMFTHDGDDEALYNVPHRPVFSLVGGAVFWAGVVIALVWTFGARRDERTAFLLLWLGAGLAPGVLSVPAASLGHTILAQTPTMMLTALAAWEGVSWMVTRTRLPNLAGAGFLVALILLEGGRDLYAYWYVWPQNGFTQVLHHSDLYEAATWLNTHADEPSNLAVGSFLTERWDQQAVRVTLDEPGWRVRAFDPRGAALIMAEGGYVAIPGYLDDTWGLIMMGSARDHQTAPHLWVMPAPPDARGDAGMVRFTNGLTLTEVEVMNEGESITVITAWVVEETLTLPPRPLLSKPPAPDEDDTPRLRIFHQVVGEDGTFIVGNDVLSVDPYTLYAGDWFVQRAILSVRLVDHPDARIVIGLYDPQTGERTPTEDGQDSFTP